jgi:hypothetical protein
MDFGEHQLKRPSHDLVDVLWVEAFRERSKPRDVDEEDRHLLAFALERALGGEDFLGQVLRGVGLRSE